MITARASPGGRIGASNDENVTIGFMRRTLIDNRYAVLDTLGEGGMARVYLAHDNVLERDVALKALREQYANDEGFVERFRREARSAAGLNHPSIVQVYDQGRAQDGTYYMAMECVPGGTLKDRIKTQGPLEPGEAAGIASRVAEALEVAHGRGIVHRDIKPQNVLLSASGEAKVADFGIARAASSKTITDTNLVLGTSAYMSPEQVRGDRAGPASDLYSLGVVLYEMLTGEQPYRADEPIATAMKHLDEPTPHPRAANPAVPEELDALVVKLLAKRPEDRYASAAELAEDLRRVRDGLAPLAAGLGDGTTAPLGEDPGRTRTAQTVVAPGRAPEVLARRRGLLPLIAALLVGVALLGGIAWALSQGPLGQNASGAERVEVPNVVGLTPEEAQGRLEDKGLEIGSRNETPSDQVGAGAVAEQAPAAGTEVERGSAVDVVISTGPAQELTSSASPSPTPSASQTASPSASPSASPAGNEEAAEEQQKAAEEAAEEAQKRREEAQKKAQEAREEAQKKEEERREKAKDRR
jgi:eukaryotic-like serine/threonine-protein kinase